MITLLAAIAFSPSIVVERLDNGVSLVAIQIPEARTFSAQTFVRAGSAYEVEGESGVSHLLEHLLFVDGEADKIAENSGLLLNATTYREFMRLHVVGPPEFWKAGILSVARLLPKPTFNAATAEWAVIGQENALALLDPDEAVHRSLWKSAAVGSPWSQPPIGDTDKIAPKSVDVAYSRYVVGSNVVAVASGGQSTRELLDALRGAYQSFPKGPSLSPPALPSWQSSSETVANRYGIGAPMPGYDEPLRYVAAEVALEALTSPARLSPLGLDAKSFLTPSSRGSFAVVSFRAIDDAPGIGTRVRQALVSPISATEFADARARCKLRYSASQPGNQALVAGLSVLLTGRTIDFGSEIDRLPKQLVDDFAAGVAK